MVEIILIPFHPFTSNKDGVYNAGRGEGGVNPSQPKKGASNKNQPQKSLFYDQSYTKTSFTTGQLSTKNVTVTQ